MPNLSLAKRTRGVEEREGEVVAVGRQVWVLLVWWDGIGCVDVTGCVRQAKA